jgi:hypothetical protein
MVRLRDALISLGFTAGVAAVIVIIFMAWAIEPWYFRAPPLPTNPDARAPHGTSQVPPFVWTPEMIQAAKEISEKQRLKDEQSPGW